jgi:NitT/TauT family transport system substrate-binding protein
MMKKNPDTVKAFMTALLSAWEFAVDPANEPQVLAQIKKKDKGTKNDIRQKQLEATRPLIKPDKETKIGIIDVGAWQQTERIMIQEKQIVGPVDVTSRLVGPQK